MSIENPRYAEMSLNEKVEAHGKETGRTAAINFFLEGGYTLRLSPNDDESRKRGIYQGSIEAEKVIQGADGNKVMRIYVKHWRQGNRDMYVAQIYIDDTRVVFGDDYSMESLLNVIQREEQKISG